jgi:hypothetical protein
MSVFQFQVGGSRAAQRFVIATAPAWWISDASGGPHCTECRGGLHIIWHSPPQSGTATCKCTPLEQHEIELEIDKR